jgi:NADPH2:quinone reductase
VRALVCRQYGPPESLTVEDVPAPQPGSGEVVVSVRAASLNFPDVLIIQNKYQFKPALPFSPGSELAGVVSAVGPDVTRFRPGDAVLAFTTSGAFAESALVEASRAFPLPAGMDFETAAAFGLTYGTSDHALVDRGSVQRGETLLVLGASGGVGIAAIEIGKVLGARVIACASTGEKLAACRAHGADETINYTTEPLRERIKAVTGGAGVDAVFDSIGGEATELSLRSTAWRGRLLVVGFAGGEIPRIPLNLPLLKGCSIVGVFFGEAARREPDRFADRLTQLGQWYREAKLRPHVSAVLPLERAAEGLARMAARQVVGKIVLTM